MLKFIVFLVAGVAFAYFAYIQFDKAFGEPGAPQGDEPVACTMDAKQCPDGSYVGRVGPNCEFAPCP